MPTPPSIDRRRLLAGSLGAAGALATGHGSAATPAPLLVENVTRLYPVEVARIEVVHSAADVAAAITRWPGQVAVGGGRYSMGGQIGVKGGLHIDMRAMNQLVWVRPADRAVRVQAGMRWRDLQDVLDPLGLAVKIMQSYSNFTIGGSVSVNCHGRYVGLGPGVALEHDGRYYPPHQPHETVGQFGWGYPTVQELRRQ